MTTTLETAKVLELHNNTFSLALDTDTNSYAKEAPGLLSGSSASGASNPTEVVLQISHFIKHLRIRSTLFIITLCHFRDMMEG